MEFEHKPIMLDECINALNINPNGVYLDCTVGGAGHSQEIAKKLKKGTLLCLDKDEDALKVSKDRLKNYENVKFFHCDFKNYEKALEFYKIEKLDGILIDLGVSSYQIDTPERGFSYMHNSNLDMRMDKSQKKSAYDVVNFYSQKQLAKIFKEYGEEQFANNIAKHIVLNREEKPIKTTFELVEIIEKAIPAKIRYSGGHPAKKVFQAIRIEVNDELLYLFETIQKLFNHLNKKGRLVILTFHSLEDRIVKKAFNLFASSCICPPEAPICNCGHKKEGILINKKPIIAQEAEIEQNPRSHSAKLRIIEKL
ncbi:MAG: 16S rRNA (cytosine(1402)-N(4))-methyltransferase RsmH [Clostridia bacterium]|nr:16S rRNA (cytosine(1402)-N(4))-methyltransferase RsmH [Clostridia bacterium]